MEIAACSRLVVSNLSTGQFWLIKVFFKGRNTCHCRSLRYRFYWNLVANWISPLRHGCLEMMTPGGWNGVVLLRSVTEEPHFTSGGLSRVTFTQWFDPASGTYLGTWVEETLEQPLDVLVFSLNRCDANFKSLVCRTRSSEAYSELFGLAGGLADGQMMLRCFYLTKPREAADAAWMIVPGNELSGIVQSLESETPEPFLQVATVSAVSQGTSHRQKTHHVDPSTPWMFVQGDDCDGIAALEAWEEARSVYPSPLGDFYREDDDVVRGITISNPDVPEPLESFNLPEVLAPRDWKKCFNGSWSEDGVNAITMSMAEKYACLHEVTIAGGWGQKSEREKRMEKLTSKLGYRPGLPRQRGGESRLDSFLPAEYRAGAFKDFKAPVAPKPRSTYSGDVKLETRQNLRILKMPPDGDRLVVESRDGDAALVFHESDVLPKFPESHLVEAKTVYLSTEVPCWKLGNRLLTFLREKAVSHIKKVNKKKYTVKAQVLCNGLVCEIKIRAYRSAKEIAVVVHRLGGDSIAFNALFRLLKQDLTTGLPLELKAEADVSPDTEIPSDEVIEVAENAVRHGPAVAPSENAFLEPIIDAAHNADDTQAQAEAAASLAAAAEDTGTVKQLCNQKAQKAIEKLLKVNCFEVSCQVVRLIMKLAVAPGAEAFFNGAGLLHLLQRKVTDLAAGKKLRVQLSQTVEKLRTRTQVRHAAHR
eukprot:s3770_g2.t2